MIQSKITILGKGAVATSTAIALAKLRPELSISIVGKANFTQSPTTTRVVALNQSSYQYLESLGIIKFLDNQALTPYNKIEVWGNDEDFNIEFTAQQAGFPQLGWIVNLAQLEQILITQLANYSNINVIEDHLVDLEPVSGLHLLTLESGEQIFTNFVIAADGANSKFRSLSDLGYKSQSYDQIALTTTIKSQQPHNSIARQTFSELGILGLLPLADPQQLSIVWSVATDLGLELANSDLKLVEQQLFKASNGLLGKLEITEPLQTFPLEKIDALEIKLDNAFLIGDAAHRIHPLAGLGLNLGFADGWRLVDTLAKDFRFDKIVSNNFLKLTRERKAQAFVISNSMTLIKNSFTNQSTPAKLLRGIAGKLLNKIDPLNDLLIKAAQGFNEIPFSLIANNEKNQLAEFNEIDVN